MTFNGWLQIVLFFVVILAITRPLGVYLVRVFEGPSRPLPRLLGPVERLLLRLCGVRGDESQSWKGYAAYLLVFQPPPYTYFCSGDGSLPTPCPCALPDTVPSPPAATGHGCANSFNLGGALLSASGTLSVKPETR